MTEGRRIGDTLLKEWLDKAGPEGKQLVDAFHRRNLTAAFAELEWAE